MFVNLLVYFLLTVNSLSYALAFWSEKEAFRSQYGSGMRMEVYLGGFHISNVANTHNNACHDSVAMTKIYQRQCKIHVCQCHHDKGKVNMSR